MPVTIGVPLGQDSENRTDRRPGKEPCAQAKKLSPSPGASNNAFQRFLRNVRQLSSNLISREAFTKQLIQIMIVDMAMGSVVNVHRDRRKLVKSTDKNLSRSRGARTRTLSNCPTLNPRSRSWFVPRCISSGLGRKLRSGSRNIANFSFVCSKIPSQTKSAPSRA